MISIYTLHLYFYKIILKENICFYKTLKTGQPSLLARNVRPLPCFPSEYEDESLWFLGLGLANVRWPLADSAFLCMLLTRVLTSGIVLMLYIFRKLNQRGPRDPEITSSGVHGHCVSPTVTQHGHNVPRAAFVPKMSNLNLMKKPRDRCKPGAVLQSTRTALFEMSAS